MGRMHSKGKGMSSSALPYRRSAPSWLKTTTAEVNIEERQESRS
jgi:small subunit ribosomal protein S13e